MSVVFGIVLLLFATKSMLAETTNGISSPLSNAVVAGSVSVRGIVMHPSFRKWQLDLLIDGDRNRATFLAVGEKPIVSDADLIIWNTVPYPNGEHILRLRIVHSDLNYDEYFIPVTINNGHSESSTMPGALLPDRTQQLQTNTTQQTSTPISARRIEIDLSDQRLIAWENGIQVLNTAVSTGRPEFPTVEGIYNIRTRFLSKRMRGPSYDTVDVPWVMFFYGGYAIHGAYWHNDFGVPISHGCVNLPVNDAKWLYEWADMGTTVSIHQ